MVTVTLVLDLEWPWKVVAYYGENAKRPRRPGDLAFETRHRSESSADIEMLAAEARPDIGRVVKVARHIHR